VRSSLLRRYKISAGQSLRYTKFAGLISRAFASLPLKSFTFSQQISHAFVLRFFFSIGGKEFLRQIVGHRLEFKGLKHLSRMTLSFDSRAAMHWQIFQSSITIGRLYYPTRQLQIHGDQTSDLLTISLNSVL
jgi:hypothetical protein